MALLWAVQTRLFKREGQRPAKLYRKDLPELTRAIIAVIRGRATVDRLTSRNVPAVRIHGNEYDIHVLKADWEKILPFIQNGTLDPKLTKTAACVGYLQPGVAYDESVIDRADRFLYQNLLGLLRQLFTDEFPTRDY